MGKPHGKSGDGEGGVILSSMAPRISREGNAAGDVENGPRSHRDRLGLLIPGGERVVTPEFPIVSTDTSGARNCTGTVAGSETYEAGSFLSSYSVAIDSQNARAMHFNDEPPQRNHRQLVVDQVAERTRDVAMVVSDPVREVTGDAHVSVIPAISSLGISPAERGPAIENEISVPLTPSQRNALEKWLKDVAQETETAATALQVRIQGPGAGAITLPLPSLLEFFTAIFHVVTRRVGSHNVAGHAGGPFMLTSSLRHARREGAVENAPRARQRREWFPSPREFSCCFGGDGALRRAPWGSSGFCR